MAESTQRFSGRTLEEAIAQATDSLGSGVEILEAKRVRRGGVFGKLQNESYEVTARARAGAARGATARSRPATFDHALRDMIDEVDLREEQLAERPTRELVQSAARRTSAAAPPARRRAAAGNGRPRVGNRFTDDDLTPLPPAVASATPARPAAARTSAPAAARPAAPAPTAARSAAPVGPAGHAGVALPPPPTGTAAVGGTIDLREQRGSGPRWSTQALRDLGVPETVLELMPTASLDGDVAWTVALEAAIRARLPLTPTVPLAVHGYGDNAAVQMLESTLNGYAIGDIHLIDRVVPATPFELTLAIRACLSR